MAIAVKRTGNKVYELASEGTHLAVLGDVIDLGIVETSFGPKERVRFRWLLETKGADGKHLSVVQTFNKSLHEKSQLYKAVKSLGGSMPEDDGELDLEVLLGANALLVIQHSEVDGKRYANVAAILKPPTNAKKLAIPAGFKRKCELQQQEPPPMTDDDNPF